MTKILFIIFFGVFLSYYGEVHSLQFPHLPVVPKTEHINPRILSSKMIGAIFFGGFRGIIVDLTWMYIDHLWHHARFYKLPPLYEFITSVQPEYIDGWVMGGWHMAYNMSLELPEVKHLTPHLRKKIELSWVYRGLEFLKAGAGLNPDNAKLDFEIGWTYYHRLKDYKNAIPWFEKSCEKKGALSVTFRLICFAYEKDGNIKKSYEKWLDLKKHSSYNDKTAKKIIDRHTKRIAELLGKNNEIRINQ